MAGDDTVTRKEFDRLLSIVHDMLGNIPHHTHSYGGGPGSDYGDSTYGPDEMDESAALRARILALIGGEPEPGGSDDDD